MTDPVWFNINAFQDGTVLKVTLTPTGRLRASIRRAGDTEPAGGFTCPEGAELRIYSEPLD